MDRNNFRGGNNCTDYFYYQQDIQKIILLTENENCIFMLIKEQEDAVS